MVEERERVAPEGGELGTEKVTRQFVDGALGIDEHLCTWIYGDDGTTVARTLWYHENARGDTVALTDEQGEVVASYVYSAYGEVAQINAEGNLEPVQDFSLCVYYFQGLYRDEETHFYYVRNRYYSPQQGRWLQRDVLGYHDSMGLYEAFGQNPIEFTDPGGEKIFVPKEAIKEVLENFEKAFWGIANIEHIAVSMDYQEKQNGEWKTTSIRPTEGYLIEAKILLPPKEQVERQLGPLMSQDIKDMYAVAEWLQEAICNEGVIYITGIGDFERSVTTPNWGEEYPIRFVEVTNKPEPSEAPDPTWLKLVHEVLGHGLHGIKREEYNVIAMEVENTFRRLNLSNDKTLGTNPRIDISHLEPKKIQEEFKEIKFLFSEREE